MGTAGTAVFAGGGSGGHLLPNVAVADYLAEAVPGLRVNYLVSERAVDRDIADRLGLDAAALPAAPFSARPAAAARFITRWGPSVRATRRVLREAKRHGPVVLIATGGFVSAPAVRAARAEGVWSALVNLDATLGKANRFAAAAASVRFIVGDSAPARWTPITPVVRRAFDAPPQAADARRSLGLEPRRPTLLVTGGSQGAASLSRAVAEALTPDLLPGWQALHQANGEVADDVRAAYDRAGVPATVVPFIGEMPTAWAAADLAIGRGGAGTVGEAWASRTPLIVLPYPNHRDAHQERNAAALIRAGAARVVTDEPDPARTAGALREAVRGHLEGSAELTATALPEASGARVIARAASGALGDGGA